MRKSRKWSGKKAVSLILAVLGILLIINILIIVVRSGSVRVEWRAPTQSEQVEVKLPETTSVVRVVDGDTIKVASEYGEQTVRLLGVNTPETVDRRKMVECFGKESSKWVKSTLEGKMVRLESDGTQGDKDKYGRWLRYVYLTDGTNVNLKIIEEGYGFEYTYELPYKYWSEFRAAQVMAQESGKGLWARGVCGGKK